MSSALFPEMFQVAEIEVYSCNQTLFNERIKITCSFKAFQTFRDNWKQNQIDEVRQFKVMLLDHDNSCLSIIDLSKGKIAISPLEVSVLLASIVKARAYSIILAHSHPKGTPKVYTDDINTLKVIIQACKKLSIRVIDYLIITSDSYLSFLDNKILLDKTKHKGVY